MLETPDVVPINLRAHPVLLDELPLSETNDSDIGISGLRRPLGYLEKLAKTILTANVSRGEMIEEVMFWLG